jgi:predicted dehydrogenase
MPVRVVVVGNSYGAYCQLPALRWAATRGGLAAHEPAAAPEVTAIVGRDLDKARATAARFAIPLATTSLDEALATLRSPRGDAALVLVSTPVDLHAPMVHQIFDTTHASVVCEKPFTLDVASARALAARAHELARNGSDEGHRRRLALVDHQLRWSAPRRSFKRLVDDGVAGTPWVARAEMCFGSMERLTRRASWWDQRERGGGAMQAIASHLVDGLLWILGPVVDVQARLTTCTKHRLLEGAAGDAGASRAVTADDHCELWLTHASGARSTVLCTTVQTHGRRSLLEVIGSRGVVRLVDEQELGHGAHDGPWTPVTDASARLASVDEVDACNDSAFARSEPLFLRDVLRAVAAGRTLPHAATFDDGAAVVDVMARAAPL